MFKDQKELKEVFGVFRVYGGIDCRSWFANIKNYCNDNYSNPNEVINYFHIFLESDLHKWLFNLTDKEKSSLEIFESSFYDEVFKMECNYEDLVSLKQTAFMDKFKLMFNNNEQIIKQISDTSLSSFISLKIMVIKRLYSSISKKDAIRMAIFSIDDFDIKKKFSLFLNSDLNDILNLAKSINLYKV